jgi:hypothetical protein
VREKYYRQELERKICRGWSRVAKRFVGKRPESVFLGEFGPDFRPRGAEA